MTESMHLTTHKKFAYCIRALGLTKQVLHTPTSSRLHVQEPRVLTEPRSGKIDTLDGSGT